MTFVSKTAGALSIISSIHDMHKTALIYSNKEYSKVQSETKIADLVGYQKANRLSYKDAQRKNWLSKSDVLLSTKEVYARIKGYVKGFFASGYSYIPKFILAFAAMVPSKEHKIFANVATVGLGIVELIDFIKNSTNLFQRKDYLKD